MTIEIGAGTVPERDELAGLYDAVGWSAYTKDLDALQRAMQGSARVVTRPQGRAPRRADPRRQ